jgi:hypothetical protein
MNLLRRANLGAAASLWNTHLGDDFPLSERVLGLTIFEDPTFREGDAIAAFEG